MFAQINQKIFYFLYIYLLEVDLRVNLKQNYEKKNPKT